jgi:hypothetical protein
MGQQPAAPFWFESHHLVLTAYTFSVYDIIHNQHCGDY